MTDTNAKVLEALFRDLLDALGPLRGYPQGADLIRRVEAAIASAESAPEAVPVSLEEQERVDRALGIVALPTIRVSEAAHSALTKLAEQRGMVLQAVVRELLTSSAPESAQAVAYSVTFEGGHCGNVFPTEQEAIAEMERLNACHPDGTRAVVPLYTHPAPARVAVALTEDQRIAVRDSLNRFPGYSERQLMVATERAVWAANGLTAQPAAGER